MPKFHEITITGTVPGKREAVRSSIVAIQQVAARLAIQMKQRQQFAYAAGGHGHRGGSQWEQLKESTIKLKGGLSAPLVRTGRAAGSVYAAVNIISHSHGISYVLKIGNSAKTVKGVHYMGLHQYGNNGIYPMNVKFPARPSLQFTQDDSKYVKDQFVLALAFSGGLPGRRL